MKIVITPAFSLWGKKCKASSPDSNLFGDHKRRLTLKLEQLNDQPWIDLSDEDTKEHCVLVHPSVYEDLCEAGRLTADLELFTPGAYYLTNIVYG